MAGKNRRANVIRFSWEDDDTVGGANPTGTTVYWDMQLRMQAQPQQQLLLQQGMETQHTFKATAIPGTLTIYERDEIEITKPRDDIYYGDRFRVIGVRYSDLNPRDPRSYLMLDLVRSERAHTSQ